MIETVRQIRTHALSWHEPLPAQAAAWLAQGWDGKGALDLRDLLVVVPTRQSGRRLRAALAELAATKNSAVLAPRVIEAKDLVALKLPEAVAAPLESRLAWIAVLRSIELNEFRDVFPVDPPIRDFAWSLRLAAQLQRLQGTLAEVGLRMGDVAGKAGADFPEAARWMQLAELEKRYDRELAARGLEDAQQARIDFACRPLLPPEYRRIAVVAAPDPLPLAIAALDRLAREVPVDVVTYGPPGESGAFDAWGRPRPEFWRNAALKHHALDFGTQVHLCADATDQAARVAGCAAEYAQPGEILVVGVGDPEIASGIEHALRGRSIEPFNPEGRAFRLAGLYALLRVFAELARESSFDTVQALARVPDFLAWVRMRGDAGSSAAVLAELDELHADHLPATIEQAIAHAGKLPAAHAALSAALELRRVLRSGEFPQNAVDALQSLFAGSASRTFDESEAAAAEAWMETLREIADATQRGASLRLAGTEAAHRSTPGKDWRPSDAELWELALATFGETRAFDERPPAAVDLVGWLELLWEDAPHLVVAGMNDGRVPDAVVGDVFLPESLRQRLGLKSNEARFARDAYILGALAASRRGDERRLDLLVGKVGAGGDPLKPSRLLFLCDDAELPGRVAQLFRELEPGGSALAWRRAWKLTPRRVPPLTRLSVTAFRDYLRCPFRFYLKHVLKMETVDPYKSEMDAFDFGHLCHHALEAMGREPALRDCRDPAALRDFLLGAFDRRAREKYGAELTLPLLVQFESARQRLSRAAEIQAEQRAQGWVIERLEHPFDFALGGVTVRGRIDRIERHEESGLIRVIDYKTSDMPKTPLAAHVRNPRRDESSPEWARFSVGDRELVWTDLQLPLYLEALAAEFGVAVTAGYFNLPKAIGDTALVLWDDYDAPWRVAARRCAEGVAQAQLAGIFWPPLEVPPRNEDDAFAGLFHHGAADSIQP